MCVYGDSVCGRNGVGVLIGVWVCVGSLETSLQIFFPLDEFSFGLVRTAVVLGRYVNWHGCSQCKLNCVYAS